MEDIKEYFKKLIDSGVIKARIGGPKNNILICKTLADWCIASSDLVRAGYIVSSPGTFGGPSKSNRTNTYNKIWRNGTVCASVVEKKVLIFTIPQTESDYCDVVCDSEELNES